MHNDEIVSVLEQTHQSRYLKLLLEGVIYEFGEHERKVLCVYRRELCTFETKLIIKIT